MFLLPGRLFAGPYHAPTLEGQYVLKDIILVAAGLVIAAGTFRGGRLVRGELAPAKRVTEGMQLDAEQKLRVVVEGMTDHNLVSEVCERYDISDAAFYEWRELSLAGATDALAHLTNGHDQRTPGTTHRRSR